jgi:hypothetical protein
VTTDKPAARVFILVAAAIFCSISIKSQLNVYDEGLILTGASRVVAGDVPYRDFWTIYSPGQFWLLATLFRLFGQSVMTARLYDTAVRVALVWAIYAVTLRATASITAALLVGTILSFWLGTIGCYGYPVFPALLAATLGVLLLLEFLRSSGLSMLLWCGVALGVTVLFRVDFGVYTGIALVGTLFFERMTAPSRGGILPTASEAALLLGAASVVTAPALLYLLDAHALGAAWRDLIVFTLTVFPRFRRLPPPSPLSLLHPLSPSLHRWVDWFWFYPPIAVLAAAAFFSARAVWRRETTSTQVQASSIAATATSLLGILLLNQAAISFSEDHALPSVILALPAAAYLVCYPLATIWERRITKLGSGVALTIMSSWLLFHGAKTMKVTPPWGCYSYLERANCVALAPVQEAAIEYVQAVTDRFEPIFVGNSRHDLIYISDPSFYFLADRPVPTPYEELHPGQATTAAVQREIIGDLTSKSVRWLVIADLPEEARAGSGVYLLDDFIRREYEPVAQFGLYEVERRRDAFAYPPLGR